jgi:DNA (cytosine-5)-methyltransferase 1
MLCGEMFGLKVLRHRYFEVEGFSVLQPPHRPHKLSVKDGTAIALYSGGVNPGMWGNKERQVQYRKERKYKLPPFDLKRWQEAVGVDWVNKKDHLSQAIPPKYSEYLGHYFKL